MTRNGIKYLQRDLERLQSQKEEPNTPISLIEKHIKDDLADLAHLEAKLAHRGKVGEQLLADVGALIDQAILS